MTQRLLFLLFLFGLGNTTIQAQIVDPSSRAATISFYKYADPSDITIEVKVWGVARNPGLYEVPQGTRLSVLLSLAGGPSGGVRARENRYTSVVRLFRQQPDGSQILVLDRTLENEMFITDEDPVVMHGDMLVMEEISKRRFDWRDGLLVATSVGTLLLLTQQLVQN